MNLLPPDVQRRADAQLGSAWRRAEEAAGAMVGVFPNLSTKSYIAIEYGHSGTGNGETPVDALEALIERLEIQHG